MADLKEKLMSLVEEAAELYPSELEAIADHLIANGVTVQKWIPVMERLPDRECIAIGFQNEMLIGWVYADAYSDTLYTAESDCEILRNVTHWMPLPEPPEEVGHGKE